MKRIVFASLILAACGPSAAELNRAQHVVYNAPFATVWNAVMGEVSKNYPSVEIEDAVAGRVRTGWRQITVDETQTGSDINPGQSDSQAIQAQQSSVGGASPTGAPMARNIPGMQVVRMWVYVKGPPWRILVDGEGAEYIPGSNVLRPFRRHAIDEPPWVQARVDRLTASIYGRLKGYAEDDKIAASAASKAMADEANAAWKNLPDQAAVELIGKVRAAAKAKNADALRAVMDGAFTWSAGGAQSADVAITMWKADPTKFNALTKMLDGGCATGAQDGATVVCPAGAPIEADAAGARAVFKKIGADWKFVVFVAE